MLKHIFRVTNIIRDHPATNKIPEKKKKHNINMYKQLQQQTTNRSS